VLKKITQLFWTVEELLKIVKAIAADKQRSSSVLQLVFDR